MPNNRCPGCTRLLGNPVVRTVRIDFTVCSACGAVVSVPRVSGQLRKISEEEERVSLTAAYLDEVLTLRAHLRAMAGHEAYHAQ